jgi:hypothetical protein
MLDARYLILDTGCLILEKEIGRLRLRLLVYVKNYTVVNASAIG